LHAIYRGCSIGKDLLATVAKALQGWEHGGGARDDLVDDVFEKAVLDGSVLLDSTLDIFKTIGDTQPLFHAWREHTLKMEHVLSADGSTTHLKYKLARDELLNPIDRSNVVTRLKTIEYLEVQAAAALRKMHNPKLAIAKYLTSQVLLLPLL
jgi:hypothetical protein